MAKVQTTSTAASAPPITLTAPTGITSGDLLLLVVSTNRVDSTYSEITTPTGFTLIGNARTATTAGGNNSTINSSLYSKVAGGSEPGSYSIAFDAANGRATMLRVSGWQSTYTFTDYASNTYSSGTASSTANAFTVTAPTLSSVNDLVLIFACQNGNTAFTATATAYTLASESSGTSNPSQTVFSTQAPTGTSFPLTTVTPSSSVGSQANTVFFLAVPTDRVVVLPLNAMGTLNATTFVRMVAAAPLNAAFVLGTVTAGTIGRVWQNLTKNISSWTRPNKS